MGVATNCKISFFTREKDFIVKYDLEGRADDFIYGLVSDGSATFEPSKYGEFTDDQKKKMKIYYDEESMSVAEGYAKVTPNVQDPKELMSIWLKIRNHIIKPFNKIMKDYKSSLNESIDLMQDEIKKSNAAKTGLFSKRNPINVKKPTIQIDDYKFDRLLFDYTWPLDSISKVIAALEIAIKNDNLVEITVSDW